MGRGSGGLSRTQEGSSPLFSQGGAAEVQVELVRGARLLPLPLSPPPLLLPSFRGAGGGGLGRGLLDSPPVSPP